MWYVKKYGHPFDKQREKVEQFLERMKNLPDSNNDDDID